ncbi:hypothetical protein Aperf_G00000030086 [Anoplocephala perfoliata]
MSDLRQAIELLRREIRNAHVKIEVDFHSMIIGSSQAFINLYRYLFCEFNRDVSLHLTSKDFFLTGTADRRFMEILYRICRDVFRIKPPLSLAQFFANSFVEKKLKMAAEIVKSVSELQSQLNKKARGAKRTPRTLSSTRSLMAHRKRTIHSSISSSTSSALAVRMPVSSVLSQKAAGDDRIRSTSFRSLQIPKTDCTSVDLAFESTDVNGYSKVDHSIKEPTKTPLMQSEADGDVVKTSCANVEPDYMPDLMNTLNTLSNQISQIVDRVAGIELRVSAMEQPVRKAATTRFSPPLTEVKQTKTAFEASRTAYLENFFSTLQHCLLKSCSSLSQSFGLSTQAECLDTPLTEDLSFELLCAGSGRKTVATGVLKLIRSDLPQKTPNGFEQYPSPPTEDFPLPEDPLSLSDVNSSVEISDPIPAPLPENKSPVNAAVGLDPDRYFPVNVALPRVSIHSEDDSKVLRNANAALQSAFTAAHNPTVLRKAFNGSCKDDDLTSRRDTKFDFPETKHIPTNYRSKSFGSGENPNFCTNRFPFTMNDKGDFISTTLNSDDDSNVRFGVDRSLEQQVNRISDMLTETQNLLNSRRPLPHS